MSALYVEAVGLNVLLVPAAPTLIVIVVPVTAVIGKDLEDALSFPARGYDCASALLSIVHVKDNDSLSIVTLSPLASV